MQCQQLNDVRGDWCLQGCMDSISLLCIYFCFPSLERGPSGTLLNGLKGMSDFTDVPVNASMLFLHSNSSEGFCDGFWQIRTLSIPWCSVAGHALYWESFRRNNWD